MSRTVLPKRLHRARRIRFVGLLILLAVAIGFTWRKYSLPEMQRFTEDFDNSVGWADPAVGNALSADPQLRQSFLISAKEAYDQGGWDAASLRVQELKWQLLAPYASDEAVLACQQAALSVAREQADPSEPCALAAPNNDRFSQMAQARLTVFRAPCDAAISDGAARRRRNENPSILSDDEYTAALARTLQSPDPLSPEEREALLDPLAPHAPICRALGKVIANELASTDAAILLRTQMTKGGMSVPTDSLIPVRKPSAESLCPHPGTVLTLSNQRSVDGRPITWTTLRLEGWDCIIESSATGRHGIWGADLFNPLRRMWPLAVGKSTTVTTLGDDGQLETSVFRVESQDRYWLPFGWYTAYAISQTVLKDDRPRYVITHYWSPQLGFKIGQHLQIISGGWPNGIAPDWQLIEMRAPEN